MRWRLSIGLVFGIGWLTSALALAQPAAPGAEPSKPAAPAAPSAPAPPVSAQQGAPPSAAAAPAAVGAEPETEPVAAPESATPPAAGEPESTLPPPGAPVAVPQGTEPEVPTPGEMEDMLSDQLGAAPQATGEFTAPTPVFTLHGYMRMRGELMDTFWLGRPDLIDYKATHPAADELGQGPDPFSRFQPIERRALPGGDAPADLSCADESRRGDRTCDVSTLRFANMRLRLSPQLNVSEDVRVKMTFDVFDNLVAGEGPSSFYGTGPGSNSTFAGTDLPPEGVKLGDSIKARRAWAEVRNRDLGELRFGRMPQEWGLGMYYNAGEGLDDDQSTDMDRVLAITKLAGLYVSASYDFIAEGITAPADDRPIDQSQLDDVDQFTFSVAKRSSAEELSADIERGELVVNGGLQFTLRNQDSLNLANPPKDSSGLRRIQATYYTSDLWGLLRYRGLRLEGELAWVTGSMDGLSADPATGEITQNGGYSINELGYALEGEWRLLDDKLALHLDHGLASGDSSVDGLSSDADFVSQKDGDDTVSTFRFHPNYRVDMILWRSLMRQVAGAYYIKPGISYDFIRNDLGELFGARLDFVWSRATAFVQTWGNDPDLGLEIDASLYFRTEDGPEIDDGYHVMLQYGVLFPMSGLGYLHEGTNLDAAQNLRLVLGVVF
jgi:uncharacterized protein (TIGR04551 family)